MALYYDDDPYYMTAAEEAAILQGEEEDLHDFREALAATVLEDHRHISPHHQVQTLLALASKIGGFSTPKWNHFANNFGRGAAWPLKTVAATLGIEG